MDRILKLSSMTTPKASFNTRSIKTMAETAKRELAIYLAAVQERVEGWWYLIDTCTHVNQEPPPSPECFYPFSTLIRMPPMFVSSLFLHCGLLSVTGRTKKNATVLLEEWQSLFGWYDLDDCEVQQLRQGAKRLTYIRIGRPKEVRAPTAYDQSFKNFHSVSVESIMNDHREGLRRCPKVRGLSGPTQEFISKILDDPSFSIRTSLLRRIPPSTSTTITTTKNDDSEEEEEAKEKSHVAHARKEALDSVISPINTNNYETLKAYNIKSSQAVESVARELVQLKGGKLIRYCSHNGKEFALQNLRKASSERKHREILTKNRKDDGSNFLKDMLQFVLSTNCKDFDERDAARSLIKSLLSEYEDEFMELLSDSGMLSTSSQMDEYTATAMFEEAGCTRTGSRVISKYLRATFGRKCIVPEQKLQAVAGEVVPATTGIYKWDHKKDTKLVKRLKIKYWYRDMKQGGGVESSEKRLQSQ